MTFTFISLAILSGDAIPHTFSSPQFQSGSWCSQVCITAREIAEHEFNLSLLGHRQLRLNSAKAPLALDFVVEMLHVSTSNIDCDLAGVQLSSMSSKDLPQARRMVMIVSVKLEGDAAEKMLCVHCTQSAHCHLSR